MLTETTITKLREMRLSVMANALKDQLEDSQYNSMAFEDRLGLIVDAEWNARKSNHLQRLIRQATFSDPAACLENVEYLPDRKLKKEELLRLGTCNYIHEHHNVILLGATGSGLCTGHGSCKTVPGSEIRPSAGSAGGIQHCPWQRNDPQTHGTVQEILPAGH